MKFIQIAIDGVAGAGKTTIAKKLAETTDINYINTGAFYRVCAMKCLESGIDLQDHKSVARFAKTFDITIGYRNGLQHTYVNGEDYTDKTFLAEAGDAASKVAVINKVRKMIIKLSRKLAKNRNCVMEGRDIASAVLKKADLKFFFTASAEIRAKRRLEQLRASGDNTSNYEEILEKIKERDERDYKRKYLPLRVVKGAIVIDTSNQSIEEITEKVKQIYQNKINAKR